MKLFVALGVCAILAACSPPKASSDAPGGASSAAASDAAASSVAVAPASELPAGFVGVWDANPACPATSDTKLTVSSEELTYFESSATIRKITVTSLTDLVVDADFSGEGETWTRAIHLVLGDDGKTLTTDEGTDKEVKRVRCVAKS